MEVNAKLKLEMLPQMTRRLAFDRAMGHAVFVGGTACDWSGDTSIANADFTLGPGLTKIYENPDMLEERWKKRAWMILHGDVCVYSYVWRLNEPPQIQSIYVYMHTYVLDTF